VKSGSALRKLGPEAGGRKSRELPKGANTRPKGADEGQGARRMAAGRLSLSRAVSETAGAGYDGETRPIETECNFFRHVVISP